jgi:hypothetical protein
MNKQATVVAATIVASGLLFSSLVAMQANGREVPFGPAAGPTVYSADHARAQETAKDEALPLTF